jgi:hypothetical protein
VVKLSEKQAIFAVNVAQKLAFRWGPSGLAIYRNGAEAASGEDFDAFALNENLYIGSDAAGANQAYANFKHTRTWSHDLTDTEMQSITR